MNQWQPIDSAPKDRKILLFWKHVNENIIQCGRWDHDRYAKKPRPYWSSDNEFHHGKAWYRNNPPTHWMPLPEPPEGT